MKSICILLSFLLINSFKLVIGEDTAVVLMNCKMEVGASDEDLKMIIEKRMPTSPTGLCLLACLYEHLGIIKEGKFVLENLSQLIGSGGVASSYVKEVTEDCKDIHNDDKCILAKDIIMCAAESVSKHLKANKEL